MVLSFTSLVQPTCGENNAKSLGTSFLVLHRLAPSVKKRDNPDKSSPILHSTVTSPTTPYL